MHEAAYAALGLEEWRYQLLPVPPELLAETLRALPGAGFRGVNVTIPHKQAALAAADQAGDAARAIGGANSLSFADGAIEADNTDAPGLVAALDDAGAQLSGARALVLGAGGTARAAAWALREGGAADVLVWNRTHERARQLAQDLDVHAVETPAAADLLVNCTPVGLKSQDDPFAALPLHRKDLGAYACVADFAYGDTETRLAAAGRAAGATVVDGLEILVRQGALSFQRWTGRAAPLEAMRAAVRAS